MIIGLDFDNTIVQYDSVFHTVALEQGHIDKTVIASKVAVRDAMRAQDKNDIWTEMQGYVYGCRMELAEMYEGAKNFIINAHDQGHQCIIISHKTQFPYAGPQYDLHKAARGWIEQNLVLNGKPLIGDVTFHETKEEKIAHIDKKQCAVFLDDLPEILKHDIFPSNTKPILFDPGRHHTNENMTRIASWAEFGAMID